VQYKALDANINFLASCNKTFVISQFATNLPYLHFYHGQNPIQAISQEGRPSEESCWSWEEIQETRGVIQFLHIQGVEAGADTTYARQY
jgi:hypothetical protein